MSDGENKIINSYVMLGMNVHWLLTIPHVQEIDTLVAIIYIIYILLISSLVFSFKKIKTILKFKLCNLNSTIIDVLNVIIRGIKN
jgi:hypothetical protein